MSEPTILIRLDDNGRTYLPGETLSGEYRVESLEGDSLDAVEVSVLWHTEGKGDEDFAVHEFWRTTPTTGELAGPRRPDRFSTTLPLSPLTYDGLIVKIRWCVRVRAILKRGRDVVSQKVFRLGNVPPARPPRAETKPAAPGPRSGPYLDSQT